MYGVPEALKLDAFLNEEIIVVHLGIHIFQLIFSNNLSISCEGKVEVIENGVSTTIRNKDWENLNPLISIQYKPIVGCKIESKKSFSLTLSDKIKIIFTDNSEKYESFQIRIGEEFLVI